MRSDLVEQIPPISFICYLFNWIFYEKTLERAERAKRAAERAKRGRLKEPRAGTRRAKRGGGLTEPRERMNYGQLKEPCEFLLTSSVICEAIPYETILSLIL